LSPNIRNPTRPKQTSTGRIKIAHKGTKKRPLALALGLLCICQEDRPPLTHIRQQSFTAYDKVSCLPNMGNPTLPFLVQQLQVAFILHTLRLSSLIHGLELIEAKTLPSHGCFADFPNLGKVTARQPHVHVRNSVGVDGLRVLT